MLSIFFSPLPRTRTLSLSSLRVGMAAAADERGGGDRWTDEVHDLVDRGDLDAATSLLESVVPLLEVRDPSSGDGDDLRLAAALGDLADLHSSRGFSLSADKLRSRALALRARAVRPPPPTVGNSEPTEHKTRVQEEIRGMEEAVVSNTKDTEEEEDDWEAIADRVAMHAGVLSLQHGVGVAPVCEENVVQHATPKRRGRGLFLYDKSVLYSDQQDFETAVEDNKLEGRSDLEINQYKNDEGTKEAQFGTRHALVVYDFPPTTRTMELEAIFEGFRDCGFAIRWVNDTVAVAVFRTPTLANDAKKCVPCQYKVRVLEEEDDLLPQLDSRDLEPPHPRPKTSARTAQRLIAQAVGIRPSMNFGSSQLKQQEEARRSRIVARQSMRDEAWGAD